MRSTLGKIWAAFIFAWTQALALSKDFATALGLYELAGERKAATEAVNSLVVIGATLLIGVVVLAQISGAMPEVEDGSPFDGVMESVNEILVSSFELGAILPLVIIAGGLLFYVMRFGNNGGMRR